MTGNPSGFEWTFQRIGGLDQVVLATGEDLRHLPELKPELWVALSCPTTGIELNQRLLDLLDADKDKHIRIPEVIEAIKWTCARLKDPGIIINPGGLLTIEAIDTDSEEGRCLAVSGRSLLDGLLNKPEASGLTDQDMALAVAQVSSQDLNGDGIVPPLASLAPEVRQFIQDCLSVLGGVEDGSGQPGVNAELAEAFMNDLRAWQDWNNTVKAAEAPLAADTAEAWLLIGQVRQKIDDYFMRCELASYAPQALTVLNVDEKLIVPTDRGLMSEKNLAELPLARIEADRPLMLDHGLNPAWRDQVERLGRLLKTKLADPAKMARQEWLNILDSFGPYAMALANKPAVTSVQVKFPATAAIDQLGEDRVSIILESGVYERFLEQAALDRAAPAKAMDIADLERLVVYHNHLYDLLINFASFKAFYTGQHQAAFQVGTLYMDGRGCHLCLYADDPAKHSVLAAFSELYLAYCRCVRVNNPGETGPEGTVNIVAAFTAGDSDLLLEDRNGVFMDNQGYDWEATVVKVVAKPISLWQAVWSPYKRFGRMVSEQISKLAGSKDAALMNTAGQKIAQTQTAATTAPATPAAPTKFDIGRSVGIFAAVGLALGALGTAVGSIARALFDLSWWHFPLIIIGLFLVISLPSVIIAWVRLRQRTLGPLLEASGWAVNGRVTIKYFLARALTGTAVLPPNARRSPAKDPLERTRKGPWVVFIAAILIGAGLVAAWLWCSHQAEPVDNAGSNVTASVNASPEAGPGQNKTKTP